MRNSREHFEEIVHRSFNGDAAGDVKSTVLQNYLMFQNIDWERRHSCRGTPSQLGLTFQRLAVQLHRQFGQDEIGNADSLKVQSAVRKILVDILQNPSRQNQLSKRWDYDFG